jgi:transcriptional regulator with XRE-family HTH domain
MDYPPVLREIMRVGELRQTDLAKRLKVTQPTVSRWLKGAKPEVDQHQRIITEARRLGVLEEEQPIDIDEPEAPPGRTARVVGYVGAGAEAHFYAVSQGDLDEVPAPDGSTEATVAVEIRGDSLGLMFDRWLVFYDQVRSPVTPDQIGRLCVVGLPDDRVLVKRLRNSSKKGLYRLLSEREQPIEDAAVVWAARVKAMVPR